MNTYNDVVNAAGNLRAAREALGAVVAKNIEEMYGLFIDYAAIGNSMNSHFEIEGVVHTLDVEIDKDTEVDYCIIHISPKCKHKSFECSVYTLAFANDSDNAKLVDAMNVSLAGGFN